MERRLFLVLLALSALMMVGCDEHDFKNPDGSYSTSKSLGYESIVIDSCEYIYGTYKLAHKGNCKYCKERRDKELKELLKQIKEK